ncbi:MAG TPA: hypothetical protein VMU57_11330 [Edaphobacter sp.]|uniref:hypothetical protein n=1 Tax=Edaphobacter sp. TaxID=1934404 RepID=UPI002D11CE63|nr:hypothetical protein [Edaphobacter sp.]HUZ95495.1 hypothetical protein [Edaphobacter sp.]
MSPRPLILIHRYQGNKDLHPDQQPAESTAGEDQAMNAEAKPVILEVKDPGNGNASLFHSFTTPLIELLLTREPIPLGRVSDVLKFVRDKETQASARAETLGD